MPPGGDEERATPGGDGALVIAATYARWDGYQGFNERDVFGTTEPAALVEAVDRFCRAQLGSGVDHYEFYATARPAAFAPSSPLRGLRSSASTSRPSPASRRPDPARLSRRPPGT